MGWHSYCFYGVRLTPCEKKMAITSSSSVATSGLSYSPTLPASTADIATLNSAEINALSTSEIAKLTSSTVTLIQPESIAGLTGGQIGAITIDQITSLPVINIAFIDTSIFLALCQFQGLGTEKIKV